MRGVYGAPFNQGGQRAIEQSLAVITHGDFPGQQAVGCHAGGLQQRAPVYLQLCQRVRALTGLRHAGYKVNQPWPSGGQCVLQTRIIKVKPTFSAGNTSVKRS